MKSKPYILSVDPGLATGICLIQREPLTLVWSDEVDWQNTTRLIDATLRQYGGENVDVVIEKYTITEQTAKKSQQTWSLEIVGMTRYLAWAHGAGEITLQMPAEAKSFATNPRLKALGLWHVGGEGHALDAIRHGLLRLVKTGWRDTRLLLP